MPDDTPKSELARKALAQRQQRERQAAAADAEKRAAQFRQERLATAWEPIQAAYVRAVDAINEELQDTGTSARMINPKDAIDMFLGRLSVTVVRDGQQSSGQYHAVQLSKSGFLTIRESFTTAGRGSEDGFDADDAGTDWVEPRLRAFFDKALS